jgi:predicted PurR-regulated permease PerM
MFELLSVVSIVFVCATLCCYVCWCCVRLEKAFDTEDQCFTFISLCLSILILIAIIGIVINNNTESQTVENEQKIELKKEKVE